MDEEQVVQAVSCLIWTLILTRRLRMKPPRRVPQAYFNPEKFNVEVELYDWHISDHFFVVRGSILFDTTGYASKDDPYRGEVLEYCYCHGYYLIKTKRYNIICWINR